MVRRLNKISFRGARVHWSSFRGARVHWSTFRGARVHWSTFRGMRGQLLQKMQNRIPRRAGPLVYIFCRIISATSGSITAKNAE
jgi:hypothetical protein